MAAPTIRQPASASVTRGPTSADPLHLTVMGPDVFETYPLPAAGTVEVGRGEEARVRLSDELASRLHARLHVEPGGALLVEDLGSSNGTFVSGARIAPGKRVSLQVGEAVTIGFTHLMVQRRRPRLSPRRVRSHAAFEERLDEACARAAESGARFALLRARVEDEDPPGAAADRIAGAIRPGDFLAQYAPGDYEILLPETEPAPARALAAALAQAARAAGLAARVAVAAFPGDGRTAEALIGRASELLRAGDDRDDDDGAAGAAEPVVKAEAMRALHRMAERAAAGTTASGLITVLILGETGTGKEVMASFIHRRSPRARGPLVCVNCAALAETLLESELFGHEKGAFTGATAAKAGLLESAARGTVFLDEIGEMTLALQVKLLRALESREITRVGGLSPRPIDVRFIAATNRDLEAEVAAGRFRPDLYFRVNGITLTIPPLRQRTAEIAPLARRFLAQAAAAGGRRPPRLGPEVLERLGSYAWPGNIRELRNVMERALVLCEGTEITAAHLPLEKMRIERPEAAPMPAPALGGDAAPSGDGGDYARIVQAMAANGWNQTKAARQLGMARGTLIARLDRYGIKRPQAQSRRDKA